MGNEVVVTVLIVAEAEGEGGEDMAHCAISDRGERVEIPASRISRDAGIPVLELPGREFTARRRSTPGGGEEYEGFRLLNDPRE